MIKIIESPDFLSVITNKILVLDTCVFIDALIHPDEFGHLFLGGLLKQLSNFYLLTKNTTDFPTNIFELKTYFSLIHRKGIQTYAVYSFNRHD